METPRQPGAPLRDLGLAFKPGHTFRDDAATYKVKVVEVGKLVTPTGKLVAADPFALHHITPLERTVKRGSYPVLVSVAGIKYKKKGHDQSRVAAASLRFTSGTPAKWVNATKRGQKLSKLPADEMFGYGVDTGTGCFADVSAAEALAALEDIEFANDNWDGYLSPKILGKLDAPTWGAGWITEPATGANVVAFPSGWGDGFYASYWGLSKTGAALCLVTDFGLYPTGG
jgi:hypothetical protein